MMGKDSAEPSVNNDMLKLLYATMLLEFPQKDVVEFWDKNPLIIGDARLSLESLLRHIWDEKKQSTFSYLEKVLAAIEPFCVAHNVPASDFVDKVVTGLNKGAVVNVSSLLTFVAPFLKFILHTDDLRYFGLKNLVPFILEKGFPPSKSSVVAHEKINNCNTTILSLCYDTTFTSKTIHPDVGLFLPRPLQLAPIRLGLPPFEEVRVLSDIVPIEKIVNNPEMFCNTRGVFINKDRIGIPVSFLAFCKKHKLSFENMAVPDVMVIEAEQDYICPLRKRCVVTKGSVYGAPMYLLQVNYSSNIAHSDQCLAPLIHESLSDKTDLWKKVQDLHERLLKEIGRKTIFVFNAQNDTISVNGQRIARYAPAIILKHIIKVYLIEGKSVFSNSDFAVSNSILEQAIAQNFSLRLQRLSQILMEKIPDVCIVKTSRGCFKFVSQCPIELVEE